MADKKVLKQWLKAGYIEKNVLHSTVSGSPQGGVTSPTYSNQTLDGLEKVIRDLSKGGDTINYVRYADDFICTANSRETLEIKVRPAIINFLKDRGLELSLEKTKITHINEGFDFLGFNIRKYRGKLLIKPSKAGIKRFCKSTREIISKSGNLSTEALIAILNSKIRGWANYYRHSVAKEIFADIDSVIFNAIWNMLKRKHLNKSTSWIRNKYFTSIGLRQWCFFCKVKTAKGKKLYTLIKASDVKIRRHVKIKGKATPFDTDFDNYFIEREERLTKERINNRIVNNINNLKRARAV
jgi:RNA-directed DNA polymerase